MPTILAMELFQTRRDAAIPPQKFLWIILIMHLEMLQLILLLDKKAQGSSEI